MVMGNDVKKAMIIDAAEDTLLRPLNLQDPKMLLPIGEVPLIQYKLYWLKSYSIQDVVINSDNLGYRVIEFPGNGY